MPSDIKVILFGATGMVGEGVLHVCLSNPNISSVLVINRKPCGIRHQKIKELLHQNFYDFSSIESHLSGYQACFFCMGVSSLGMSEEKYHRITFDLTMHVANTLVKLNNNLTFCYITGTGADSTEKGRSMWARVKGKTENALLKLPFKGAYMFRPGYIQPIKGLKNTYKIYKPIAPFYPILKRLFPKYMTTLEEIGLAMIQCATHSSQKPVLECQDIILLAHKNN